MDVVIEQVNLLLCWFQTILLFLNWCEMVSVASEKMTPKYEAYSWGKKENGWKRPLVPGLFLLLWELFFLKKQQGTFVSCSG